MRVSPPPDSPAPASDLASNSPLFRFSSLGKHVDCHTRDRLTKSEKGSITNTPSLDYFGKKTTNAEKRNRRKKVTYINTNIALRIFIAT